MMIMTVDPQVVQEEAREVVNRFHDLYPSVKDVLVNLAIMIVILIIGNRLIYFGAKMMKKALGKVNLEEGVKRFLVSLTKVAAYVLLVFILADRLGISSASILAVLGSAGLAIGLALQGSLSNFAGGVLLLTVKPFVVGDYVVTPQAEGQVKEIGMIYTTLITVDNKKVTIPNGSLSNGVITNVTAMKERRLDLSIELDSDADIEKAREAVLRIMEESEYLLKEKSREVFIDGLQNTGVIMGVRCWCSTENYAVLKWELLEKIKKDFARRRIELAKIRYA